MRRLKCIDGLNRPQLQGGMRNVGYIKMHRGWMDNEALKDNDERVLWVTIIERAAWEDTVTFVNGVRVSILAALLLPASESCQTRWTGMPRGSAGFLTDLRSAT